jgi:glycosyltransferase involved in cell wall biosynthesis
MNVLHLSCVAPPETGGIGQAASEIVERLCARGVTATLVAPALRVKHAEPDPAWVKRVPTFLRVGNAAILQGLKSLIQQADVVHLHYPFFGVAESVAQDCLWMRKPLVMTFHMDATSDGIASAVFDTNILGRVPGMRAVRKACVAIPDTLYRVLVQPAIVRAARTIFVSSADYADHSSIAGFRRTHMARVKELPFGVDSERFCPSVTPSFYASVAPGKRLVGFVGGMDAAHAFKGIPVLLQALTFLPTDVHALLVGDGAQRRIFEAKARELGIADRAHFVGRASHEHLPHAYSAMDVLAFPSTGAAEAFGLVAVEAMACGVPVVASNLPGVRSVVADGVTGLLVPPSDAEALAQALSRILDSAMLREGMSRAARERATSRYSWDRHVDGLIEEYQKRSPLKSAP